MPFRLRSKYQTGHERRRKHGFVKTGKRFGSLRLPRVAPGVRGILAKLYPIPTSQDGFSTSLDVTVVVLLLGS
jgi:hypothetical protein